MTLTSQQQLFVEAYDGDTVYAMRVAGYSGTEASLRSHANKLLANPKIVEAIKARSKHIVKMQKAIADREERQELWTNIMRNNDPYRKEEVDSNGVPIPEGNIPLPIRLKASELLGKSEADFIEKIDMTANVTITDIISQSYQDDSDIEAIEAEYQTLKERKALTNMEDSIEETPPAPDLEDFV